MVSPTTASDALARLDPDERGAVEDFRDGVRAMLGDRLRDLRLYGSRARGERHDESDLDLLVLVDDVTEDDRERVIGLACQIDPRLSTVVKDFDGYHAPISRATGFYKELRKESVRL